MKNSFNKITSYFDNLKFSYKTSFLVFIIAGGMISIIILFQISIFTIKQDFDVLFDKRTTSLIKLENIKDTYKVNIQETLKDLENKNLSYKQAKEVLQLGEQLINKNWNDYKKINILEQDNLISNFIKKFMLENQASNENKILKDSIMNNIDKKMITIKSILNSLDTSKKYFSEINLQVNGLNIYITSLINYDLSIALNEKRKTDKIFNIIIIFSFITIFFVFLFSIFLTLFIINNFKKLHNSLEQKVEDKTKELTELNNYLEIKISKEVAQNRKKDMIMTQQAKLASMGEMLNNIAHQWRQPLGSITMIIQSFQTKMNMGKLTYDFVEDKVNDALLLADNMSTTLDDFKNFFNPDKSKSSFDLRKCIEHSIELSKYILTKENIHIELSMKKDIKINSYYNELSHVFLNLISNSKDALATNVDKNDRIIKIVVSKYKNEAIINIIDNGGGIPKEVISKVFEPYYTTKYKSAGTGIGLYMSKQIIERHMNGAISCKNINHKIKNDKNYKCTLFTIKLPIENDNNEEINEQ
ncbi:hypothetical protein GCM10012288_13110 [Malaciobacter pacificus]|jgi:signal transduction histidine kinase|uniref:histidine kinase n=1 Tax=Malaciobacter pacificus TaxID=1080223 RepID=A0A5C2H795_9BACT|nr:HAMP domain-containing sensor histidine kinase [Malaciobacter pacificus]QEP34098.1 two-component system sensor histidine kinase [Malaciobacter pacificus]GGD40399.1 hypothetical protein GCM10012288_13110 [Malaciobacter pacificus]